MIKYRKLKNLLIWKCKQKKVTTQLPTATRMAELEEVEPQVPLVLLPCTSCSRTFRPEALAKHAKVCEKTLMKKRKKFDSARQRLQGTDVPQFPPPPKQKESPLKPIAQSKWREKQVELTRSLNSVRKKSDGGASLPVKPSDHQECPFCERHFGPKAYDRHTEWCKEQQAKLKHNNVNIEARERLQVRTKYRAPLSNKVLTRDKYLPRSRDPSPLGLSRIEAEDPLKQKLPSPLNRSQSLRMNGRSRSLIAKTSPTVPAAELRNTNIRNHTSSINVRTREVPKSPKEPQRASTTTNGENTKPRIVSNNNNPKKVPMVDREAELRKCRSWTSQAFLDPTPNAEELQVHSCILHPITVKRSQEGSLSLSDKTKQSASVSKSFDILPPTYIIDRFTTPGPCLLQADRVLRQTSPELFSSEQDEDQTSEMVSDNIMGPETLNASDITKNDNFLISSQTKSDCYPTTGKLKSNISPSESLENTSISYDKKSDHVPIIYANRRLKSGTINTEKFLASSRLTDDTMVSNDIDKSESTTRVSKLETDITVMHETVETDTVPFSGTGLSRNDIHKEISWKLLPVVFAYEVEPNQRPLLALEYKTAVSDAERSVDQSLHSGSESVHSDEESENSYAESGKTFDAHAEMLKSVADEYMAWFKQADAKCTSDTYHYGAGVSDTDSQLSAEEHQGSFFLDLNSFLENSATSECVYTENISCPRVVRIEGIVEINEVGTTVDDLEDFIKQNELNNVSSNSKPLSSSPHCYVAVPKKSSYEKSCSLESLAIQQPSLSTNGHPNPDFKPKTSASCHSFSSRSPLKTLPDHPYRSCESIAIQAQILLECDNEDIEDRSSYTICDHDANLPESAANIQLNNTVYIVDSKGSLKTLNENGFQSDNESIDSQPLTLDVADNEQSTEEEDESRMDLIPPNENIPNLAHTASILDSKKRDILGEPQNGKIHTLNDLIAFVIDAKNTSVGEFPKNVLNYNVPNVPVFNEFQQDLIKLIDEKISRKSVSFKTESVQVDLPCPVCQKCKRMENNDKTTWTTLALEADFEPKYCVEVDVSNLKDELPEETESLGVKRSLVEPDVSQDDGTLESMADSEWDLSSSCSCSCVSSERVTDKKVLRKKTVKYYETIEYKDTKTGPSTIKTSLTELPPLKNPPKYVVAKTTKKEVKPIISERDRGVLRVQEACCGGAGENMKLPPIKRRFERHPPCLTRASSGDGDSARTDRPKFCSGDSVKTDPSKFCSGDSAKMDPPKFCHECGTKYPVPMAKFCCNCGIRRITI